jgi:WD40 repeat protein
VSARAVEASAAAAAAAERRTPYQGLVPYTEADADWFFGRDEWCEVVGDNLRAYRITVLYGTSGVGKSSVLRAGLVRRLADEARGNVADFGLPRLLPVVFSAWSLDDPITALKETIATAAHELAPELAGEPPEGSLADVLGAWPERIEGPVLVVLDQFEEFFLYHDRFGDSALDEIGAALRRRNPAVHFLISIREDSLARLDRFKGHVPGLLDHLLRIDHLDRDAAREAIVLPLERWSRLLAAPGEEVEAEPALVEAVLDQVTAGRVSLDEAGAGSGAPALGAAEGIVAPYLQLVLERLWDEERRRWDAQEAGGTRFLRLQTLEQWGGADRIVRTHLDAALAALAEREQDVAGKVFRHLVTPSGTKIALRISDLAEYAHLPEKRVEPLIEQLTGDVRILRGAGEGRYEIYHDALAGPILDWSARWQERQRRRRERQRLMAALGIAIVLAAIAAVITVLAVQARHAQQAARVGQSQALAGQALASIDADPLEGLRSAIRSTEISPTREAEDALRGALAGDLLRKTLHGHTGFVESAAFSPDGKHILTASGDGTARIWDAVTGRSLHILNGHINRYSLNDQSAAVSPDGKLVVTAGDDGKARIWDAANGRRLRTLSGHTESVDSATFSPDGKLVVTGSSDRTARIWEVASGHSLHTLTGAGYTASFSPDGKLLVTVAAFDGTVRIWDAASGRPLHTLRGQKSFVDSAAFSPDGKLVVTASRDRTARIWEAASGRRLHTLRGHTDSVYSAAFSPDGKLVVTAGADHTVRIWNAASGRSVHTLVGHTDSVYSTAFSPDGKLVVSAGADHTVRIWDAASGDSLHILNGHTDRVDSVAFSPDGKLIVTAGGDRTARIWDAASDRRSHTLSGHRGSVFNAAFSPDGKLIVTAGRDRTARIWQVASGRSLHTLKGAGQTGSFSPDGKLVVTAGGVAKARIWDTASGQSVHILSGHIGTVNNAAFSRNGKLVVTAGVDRTARIWDVASGRSLHTLGRSRRVRSDPFVAHATAYTAAFSPDGKLVVASSRHGTARIWDTASGRSLHALSGRTGPAQTVAFSPTGNLVVTTVSFDLTARIWDTASGRSLHTLSGHTGSVYTAVFSPDGKLVVTASDDHTARIWDAASGRSLHTLSGHTKSVYSAAFSPDGKLVVTASEDRTARIWEVASGRSLYTFVGHTGGVSSAAFSPDGRRVVTASADGTARIWPCDVCGVPLDQLLSRARVRLFSSG